MEETHGKAGSARRQVVGGARDGGERGWVDNGAAYSTQEADAGTCIYQRTAHDNASTEKSIRFPVPALIPRLFHTRTQRPRNAHRIKRGTARFPNPSNANSATKTERKHHIRCWELAREGVAPGTRTKTAPLPQYSLFLRLHCEEHNLVRRSCSLQRHSSISIIIAILLYSPPSSLPKI